MNNKDMILSALNLQCDVNDVLDPTWMTGDRPYLLAAIIEVGELTQSAEVVWWTKNSLNKHNMILECGDIMAFILSHELRTVGNIDETVTSITNRIIADTELKRISVTPMPRMLLSLAENISDIGLVMYNIQKILYKIGYSIQDLMLVHKHKSVLNIHRAKHGYGTGMYTKVVDGVEDNEALRLIIKKAPEDASYDTHFEELIKLGYTNSK